MNKFQQFLVLTILLFIFVTGWKLRSLREEIYILRNDVKRNELMNLENNQNLLKDKLFNLYLFEDIYSKIDTGWVPGPIMTDTTTSRDSVKVSLKFM